jgi:hypothetical protein
MSKVIGGIGTGFVSGMHVAFIALALMLVIAGEFSFATGTGNRGGISYMSGHSKGINTGNG